MGRIIRLIQKPLAIIALFPLAMAPQLAFSKSNQTFLMGGQHRVQLDFKYAKDLLSKLPKNATLGNLYDQASRHLSPKQKEQFLRHYSKQGSWRSIQLPTAKFGSDSILLTENVGKTKQTYKMKFILDENTYVKINGQAISYNQLHRPKELLEKMSSISGKTKKTSKFSFLIGLFIPQANAFFGGGGMGMMMMMMMLPMLMGGGGGGGMGMMMSIMPMMMMMSMMKSSTPKRSYSAP